MTFDTHEFINLPEACGLPEQQAEAVAEAFKEALSDQQPDTRECLDYRLKVGLADLQLDLIKWVTGALRLLR